MKNIDLQGDEKKALILICFNMLAIITIIISGILLIKKKENNLKACRNNLPNINWIEEDLESELLTNDISVTLGIRKNIIFRRE